jgi:hypothetical protein
MGAKSALLILGLLLIALSAGGRANAQSSDEPQRPTTPLSQLFSGSGVNPDGVTTCQMGPITFHVPNGYRPACYKAAKPGGPSGLMFWVMLPEVGPVTKENEAEFNNPGLYKQIFSNIHYDSGPSSGEKLQQRYRSLIVKDKITTTDGVYTVTEIDHGNYRGLYENDSFKPNFFACTLPGRLYTILPCQIIEPLNTDIVGQDETGKNKLTLDYEINHDYLDDFPRIDQKLLALVASFEQLPSSTPNKDSNP